MRLGDIPHFVETNGLVFIGVAIQRNVSHLSLSSWGEQKTTERQVISLIYSCVDLTLHLFIVRIYLFGSRTTPALQFSAVWPYIKKG